MNVFFKVVGNVFLIQFFCLLLLGLGFTIGVSAPFYEPVFADALYPDANYNYIDKFNVSEFKGNGVFMLRFKDENNCLDLATATGNSMLPSTSFRNKILVDYCFPVEDLDIGNVIIFMRATGKSTSHRIVAIDWDSNKLITQGDNNRNPDVLVDFKNYRGKVVSVFEVYDAREKPEIVGWKLKN